MFSFLACVSGCVGRDEDVYVDGGVLGLVLDGDDLAASAPYEATAHVAGTVTEQDASGTIAYAEAGDSRSCEGVIAWSASGLDTPCTDCVWSHAVAATGADMSGDCDFGVLELSMMPDDDEHTYFAYREGYDADDGERYDRHFSYVVGDGEGGGAIYPLYREVDGAVVGGPAWSPSTGALAFDAGPVGGEARALSRECVEIDLPVSEQSFLGESPAEETLPCGQSLAADRWSFAAEAGQVLGLTVDSEAGVPIEIRVVAPDGCAEAASVTGVRCSGGGDCPSLGWAVPGTGTWTAVVSAEGCTSEIRYAIGGRLE
ncbi:MAG: hypothetical protein FJ102_02955 [Deltaproteobacteria bacterium]|nr:hypothetical protein [Deltaproteobacteria bacterium]